MIVASATTRLLFAATGIPAAAVSGRALDVTITAKVLPSYTRGEGDEEEEEKKNK
jgi:hypothetical protein